MDEPMFLDGHSLWIVVFLIIIVVSLSCGLLGFICKMIIEDFYNDGVKPIFNFTGGGKIGNDQALVPPTKIIVTKPQDTATASLTSVTDPVHDGESKDDKKKKRRIPSSNQSDSPCDEIIFSCDNSPLGSPTETTTERVYHWSKSNNNSWKTPDTVVQDEKPNNINNFNARVEVNSPLSFYSTTMSSRCYSAPTRPYLNRTETILYM